jgi:penicillin-binding protein 1A
VAAFAGGAALAGAAGIAAWLLVVAAVYQVYFDRDDLPDVEPFIRFEFPTIGHIYDADGEPLIELAREYRRITPYTAIPPVVRGAILAAEDKRFFSHAGVDVYSFPRVIAKVRFGAWATWLLAGSDRDNAAGRAVFPQGGSTITQQLVRGVFLQRQTSRENSYELRNVGLVPRALAWIAGARNVNMLLRKREEIRLSVWLEQQMQARFGSKRRAKEEIFARYASFVYMGRGQYGVACAADYYFGMPLSAFSDGDADKAAMLASIAKSPRDYAPTAENQAPVRRRRNQILALMVADGFLSAAERLVAQERPLPTAAQLALPPVASAAVIEHVIDELTATHPELGIDDLLQGNIQVHSTVDAAVQRIATEALEHGLERYEKRHPKAREVVQGSIVVLRNADGSILAEVGGRQHYRGRGATYSDFNRARVSARQPGSAMKPFVYLAAFRSGNFTLDTLVPDEPISVPNGGDAEPKWIANYDGRFKGLIPIRMAFAESRNTVAIWIAEQVGIGSVIRTARSLGVRTPLHPYVATALGASEMTLIELASAYRTIASGQQAAPQLIRRVVRRDGELLDGPAPRPRAIPEGDDALALVQEALRSAVRLPSGTAHALDKRAFPIAVMGKTGTTSEFRDALFVGSTYGRDGITVAVRIGFDDNRSLGRRETGGRVALPVFEEVMLKVYGLGVVGKAPAFPRQMEQRINRYLADSVALAAMTVASGAAAVPSGTARTP